MLITVEFAARLTHEVNRAYCQSIGDNSQPTWENAPQWQRDSAIAGVNFRIANPLATPADMHASWLKQKEADGWKYGPIKNPETKEHPCFVPYDELPADQKSKDYLFGAVVETLRQFMLVTKGTEEMDVSFNVSASPLVHAIKIACADAWDTIDKAVTDHIATNPTSTDALVGKIKRLEAMAKTSIEMASMQGVKAVTRK